MYDSFLPCLQGASLTFVLFLVRLDVYLATPFALWVQLDSLDVTEVDVEKPYTLADVVHAGMQALQEPATVVLPLVAFAHSARTISCAIQIYLEREVLGSHKLASEHTKQHWLVTNVS